MMVANLQTRNMLELMKYSGWGGRSGLFAGPGHFSLYSGNLAKQSMSAILLY